MSEAAKISWTHNHEFGLLRLDRLDPPSNSFANIVALKNCLFDVKIKNNYK